METYSLSLTDQPVVEPNIAIQSVNVPSGGKEGSTGVLFTVLKGELFVLSSCNSREYSASNICSIHENVDFYKILLFFLLIGTSNSLAPGSTRVNVDVDKLNPNEQTELQLLLNTSKSRSQITLLEKCTQIHVINSLEVIEQEIMFT